jgi:hypothetical protein
MIIAELFNPGKDIANSKGLWPAPRKPLPPHSGRSAAIVDNALVT